MQPTSCCTALSSQGIMRRSLKKGAGTVVRNRTRRSGTRRPRALRTGTTCAACPNPCAEIAAQISGKAGSLLQLAARVVRFHRGDTVQEFQIELLDQFVERPLAHVGSDFAHDQIDRRGGMLTILSYGCFKACSGFIEIHHGLP